MSWGMGTNPHGDGFRVVTAKCPVCSHDGWVSRDLSMHVAGLAVHLAGIWSVCTWCGHESISIFDHGSAEEDYLRGDHHMERV